VGQAASRQVKTAGTVPFVKEGLFDLSKKGSTGCAKGLWWWASQPILRFAARSIMTLGFAAHPKIEGKRLQITACH
jgi:hypothetical protein